MFELEVNSCPKQVKNFCLSFIRGLTVTQNSPAVAEDVFIVIGFWQKNSKLIRICKAIGVKFIVVLYMY